MGRKRKTGDRYPSGKLKPANKPSFDAISGAEWQRIRQAGKALGADPRLATELGRLHLFGELTIVQATAGHRVAEIYGRFEALEGLRRSAKSPSYERAFGARAESEVRAEQRAAAREAYLALHKVFEELCPAVTAGRNEKGLPVIARKHRLVDALEELCVSDRSISPTLYGDLRDLLQALAERWQISTVSGKRPGSVKRRAAKDEPKLSPPPRINADKESWLVLMRTMRPDLDEDSLEYAYELAQAHKQRTIFNHSKKSEPPTPEPGPAVRLDRPKLTLPDKETQNA